MGAGGHLASWQSRGLVCAAPASRKPLPLHCVPSGADGVETLSPVATYVSRLSHLLITQSAGGGWGGVLSGSSTETQGPSPYSPGASWALTVAGDQGHRLEPPVTWGERSSQPQWGKGVLDNTTPRGVWAQGTLALGARTFSTAPAPAPLPRCPGSSLGCLQLALTATPCSPHPPSPHQNPPHHHILLCRSPFRDQASPMPATAALASGF